MSTKELRTSLSLTQSELAAAIGVSVRTVMAWEQGKRNPSAEHRHRLTYLQTDESTRQRTFYGSVHALSLEALTNQQARDNPDPFWNEAARALLTIRSPAAFVTQGSGEGE